MFLDPGHLKMSCHPGGDEHRINLWIIQSSLWKNSASCRRPGVETFGGCELLGSWICALHLIQGKKISGTESWVVLFQTPTKKDQMCVLCKFVLCVNVQVCFNDMIMRPVTAWFTKLRRLSRIFSASHVFGKMLKIGELQLRGQRLQSPAASCGG